MEPLTGIDLQIMIDGPCQNLVGKSCVWILFASSVGTAPPPSLVAGIFGQARQRFLAPSHIFQNDGP